jgi:beta-galactosidase
LTDGVLSASVRVPEVPYLNITGPVTLEAEVKPAPAGDHACFISKGDTQWALQVAGNQLEFFVYEEGRRRSWITARAPFPDNWLGQWHRVAGVFDGKELRLYVDGRQLAATPFSGTVASAAYPVEIGGNAEHPERVASGLIREARIYSRALSDAELAQSTRGADSALALWLKMDEASKQSAPAGKFFWAYGGDYGPPGTPSDDNFCCNGLVNPEREPHPGLFQVKHVYQNIHCQAVDLAARTIDLKNWYFFTNLKDLAAGHWRLKADGKEIQHGELPTLDVEPGATSRLSLPVQSFALEPGIEYFLELNFTLKHDLPWAKAGHEIAWDEFKLPDAATTTPLSPDKLPTPRLTQDTTRATVGGKDFEAVFDKLAGTLKSWRFKGTELIESPLRPDFWRGEIDNDRGRNMARSQGIWHEAHQDAALRKLVVREDPDARAVSVSVTTGLPRVDATWQTDYTVYGNGDILVAAYFKPGRTNLPDLVRLGMQMTLPKGFERIAWLGPGPQETYADRKDSRVGLYSGTVDQQFYSDYTEPGESGNKADARWVALSNGKNVGLLAIGLPLLSANALHYGTDDLNAGKHAFELPHRDYITLNLDLKQQGVGGDDSWGAWPHAEFLIPCREYQYSFRLRPFASGQDPAKLARQ